jgi:long-chain acyl-CoA synthetase
MSRNFVDYDYRINTILDVFYSNALKYKDKVFLKKREISGWKDFTWKETLEKVEALASYLIKCGIKKGDIVAIYSSNRPEWVIADLAVLISGAVDIAFYDHSSTSEVIQLLNDSKASLCFCDDRDRSFSLLSQRDKLPFLKKIIAFDDNAVDSGAIALSHAIAEGSANLKAEEIKNIRSSIKGDDLMTVIYSSGSSSQPQGVMLTHKNIMFTVSKFTMRQNLPEGLTSISILPLAHVSERLMGYYSVMLDGGVICFSTGLNSFINDCIEVKPNYGVLCPYILGSIYNSFMLKLKGLPAYRQNFVKKSLTAAREVEQFYLAGKSLPLFLRFKYFLLNRLVFWKLKRALGLHRAIAFISTGTSPVYEVKSFFWGLKIQLRDVYGLTETSGVLSAEGLPSIMALKSDGSIPPFPETEIKIVNDEEILVKGPQIMKGYFNRPYETEQIFNKDGFLKTGDKGTIDKYGYLKIIERKSDIIITANGKKITPQIIENSFASHPMIDHILIVGDGKKYLGALIFPNFKNLYPWAESKGINTESAEKLLREGAILNKYQRIIDKLNRSFCQIEPIKKFILVPQELLPGGDLTPLYSIKRKAVMAKYKDLIDSLFVE